MVAIDPAATLKHLGVGAKQLVEIVKALAKTGRLITCGALILAFSFASIATGEDVIVRMIATPLAFGILLDAIVVRSLVVPALVALMGRWNWWMPDGLSRLLRIPPPPPVEAPADPA